MSSNTAEQVLTVTEAAEARRSIRKYEPTPIPRAHLEEIFASPALHRRPGTCSRGGS